MSKTDRPTTTLRISKDDSEFIKGKYVTLQNFFDKKIEEERAEEEKKEKMIKNLRGES